MVEFLIWFMEMGEKQERMRLGKYWEALNVGALARRENNIMG
jgi:hypothetical protein